MTAFVEGWDFMETLGEGAYGRILYSSNASGCSCQFDFMDKETEGNKTVSVSWNALGGGELFDRIEPDVGMPQHQAQRYFQAAYRWSGVPSQNKALLTETLNLRTFCLEFSDDNLKITDFGFSTVFRHKGKERPWGNAVEPLHMLHRRFCPRVNTELSLQTSWSCGIVFSLQMFSRRTSMG
ncbi:Serine/threonine-protein kinase Chk1 [Desmophyllum pertusum]|uniref:Serine/threonine-protein kinase Chk1 n=1 Tax=Desmophyllum pertusum TaxID=174260 RepID=A0A9W9YF34_9CNID|nr:Serine/threonine-protein kinase Chk1 [Desmophyllum pertusum]